MAITEFTIVVNFLCQFDQWVEWWAEVVLSPSIMQMIHRACCRVNGRVGQQLNTVVFILNTTFYCLLFTLLYTITWCRVQKLIRYTDDRIADVDVECKCWNCSLIIMTVQHDINYINECVVCTQRKASTPARSWIIKQFQRLQDK